jgi:hypothetical protein
MSAHKQGHRRIGPLVRHGKCHSFLIGHDRIDDGIIQRYSLIDIIIILGIKYKDRGIYEPLESRESLTSTTKPNPMDGRR